MSIKITKQVYRLSLNFIVWLNKNKFVDALSPAAKALAERHKLTVELNAYDAAGATHGLLLPGVNIHHKWVRPECVLMATLETDMPVDGAS